jgi:hypothetical protein
MRIFFFSFVLSIVTVAHAAPFPSPQDWRDENIYFIFTDRFFDGDPANNNVEAGGGAHLGCPPTAETR